MHLLGDRITSRLISNSLVEILVHVCDQTPLVAWKQLKTHCRSFCRGQLTIRVMPHAIAKGETTANFIRSWTIPGHFLTRTTALPLLYLQKIKIFEGLNMLTVETHSLLSASAVRAALALWERVTFKEEIGLEEDRLVKWKDNKDSNREGT